MPYPFETTTNEAVLKTEIVTDTQPLYSNAFSPLNPPKKNEMALGEAIFRRTLPVKAAAGFDYLMLRANAAVTGSNMFERDANFDPIKVFEQGGHTPDEFDTISKMDNMNEYTIYSQNRTQQMKAAQTVDAAGFSGGVADFLAYAFTDPTTYAGFGAASMLSKGIRSSVAYGSSFAAAQVVSEGMEQAVDLGEVRSITDSAIAVGAAGVFGGLLGGAVELWAKRNPTKNFTEESGKAVREVLNRDAVIDEALPTFDSTVGAMRVANPEKIHPDASLISGRLARSVARVYSVLRLAPSITGAVAKNEESRLATSKFYEVQARTNAIEEGVAREDSFVGNHLVIDAEAQGAQIGFKNFLEELVGNGHVIDERVMDEAFQHATRIKLSSDPIVIAIADKQLAFYGKFANTFKDAEGFNLRENYIPSEIKKSTIMDFDSFQRFSDTIVTQWKKAMPAMKQDLVKLENRIKNLQESLKQAMPPLDKYRVQQRINKYLEEQEFYKNMVGRTDDELTLDAMDFARKVRDGDINIDLKASPTAGRKYPSEFMERVFDQKLFHPYLEKNPLLLMSTYARNTSPYAASVKTFGDVDPSNFIKSYTDQMDEKIKELSSKLRTPEIKSNPKNIAKIEKQIKETKDEKDRIAKEMSQSWDSLTGKQAIDARAYYNNDALYNSLQTAKAYNSAVSLGNSTLASLSEFFAPLLSNGFRGQAKFMEALGKMIAGSPEMKAAIKKDGERFSLALNTAVKWHLSKNFMAELSQQGAGSGISSRIAKGANVLNNYSMIANAQVPFTAVIRTALKLMQQDELRISIGDLISGKISKAKKADLAFLGIDSQYADDIMKMADKYGEEIDGFYYFNYEDWGNPVEVTKTETALVKKQIEKIDKINTRGLGVQYHGTSSEIKDLQEFTYSPQNIYGQGFYTTDAGDIAIGYAQKGKGKSPAIYKIEEKFPTKMFDMEETISIDNEISQKLNELRKTDYNLDEAIYVAEDANGNFKLVDVYDELRNVAASADELQETMDSIQYMVSDLGFDGFKHIGGKLTGKDAHNVQIYFDPKNTLSLTKIDSNSEFFKKRTEDVFESVLITKKVMEPNKHGQFLADKIKLALVRDNRRASLNPTAGDVPHAFRGPIGGLITQFKSWAVTAGHTYGLAALQKTDAQSLMATSTYVGMSGLAYMLAEVARGNEPPTDADEIIYAAFTNSGLFGAFPEAGPHWLANKLLGIESGGAKYADTRDPIEAALGPTFSKAKDVWGLTEPIRSGDLDLDNRFYRDLLDSLPAPFVKPALKNIFLPIE